MAPRDLACAVQTNGGTIACSGKNELGYESGGKTDGPYAEVSAASQYVCAIKAEGTMSCWAMYGSDSIRPQTPPPGPWAQVSTGDEHVCGVKNDGALVCWATEASVLSTPPSAPPISDGFRQISVGGRHDCGLQADGSIVCWGSNDYGQLAPPPPESAAPPPSDSPAIAPSTGVPADTDPEADTQ